MTKGLCFYACNTHPPEITRACCAQLEKTTDCYELVCVSLKPMDFGDQNIVLSLSRGPVTQATQILAGLEALNTDVVFLVESDVLYHPSHFDFTPPSHDVFCYNLHVWRVRYSDGHAVRTAVCRQVSGLCASRTLLLEHYSARLTRLEREGRGKLAFEPGCNQHEPNPYGVVDWRSAYPNLDIRHARTMTASKWTPEDFRNQKWAEGWEETDGPIEDWGTPADIVRQIKEGTA